MKNIVLVGMPGSGKSAAGRALAGLLRRPFLDADAEMERAAGKTVAEIFAADGEPHFRQQEGETLSKILTADGQVVATGGGAVLSAQNRKLMRARGRVVYLAAAPEILEQRLQKDAATRPLLAGDELPKKIAKLLAAREKLYQKTAHLAAVQHREDSPRAVAGKIHKALETLKFL